jgi:hypothetical protein
MLHCLEGGRLLGAAGLPLLPGALRLSTPDGPRGCQPDAITGLHCLPCGAPTPQGRCQAEAACAAPSTNGPGPAGGNKVQWEAVTQGIHY